MKFELPEFLKDREASQRALLNLLRAQMNKKIDLTAIAEADYGRDAEEHYLALEKIFDSGEIPRKIPLWYPREVLELFSFSCPEAPNWKLGNTGERGHLQRAFVCAVLLRSINFSTFDDDDNDTLAALIDSCFFLGEEYRTALEAFLAWRLRQFPATKTLLWDEALGCGFYALGYLVVCCESYLDRKRRGIAPSLDDAALAQLFEWAIKIGDYSAEATDKALGRSSTQWLLGSTCFDSRHDLWRAFAQRVFIDSNADLPPAARTSAHMLGDAMLAPRISEME